MAVRIHSGILMVYMALYSSTYRALAQSSNLAEAVENRGSPLYPQDSETRETKRLDGIWNFRRSPINPQHGFIHNWFADDLEKTGPVEGMPVPSSYNDITMDATLRDHVGLVWYDRRFYVSPHWLRSEQRVWLRFSSVHYAAQVWVNGNAAVHHEIGHLPFEVEITTMVSAGESNLLTVACDNTLLKDSVPQGAVQKQSYRNDTLLVQKYSFDFFNYAGIHRSVFLYTTPQIYIDDIVVNTDVKGLTGFVIYNVSYKGTSESSITFLIELLDKFGVLVASSNTSAGLLGVVNANLWWPYLMHQEPGYLYTLKASLLNEEGYIIDTYRQKVGIRTVAWNNTVFINERPIYMRGFGMHEDSDIRGKGWDAALWVKNFNLIQWVGANAFRTSHYPYAEEIYQLADERGIMIIDECPSVDTENFSDALLQKHKQSLTELIRRDKNHPSVIMWSIANEPRTQTYAAGNYFKQVVEHVKTLDLSRPVTIAIARGYSEDKAGQYLDVISFNRYNAWYHNTGQLYVVTESVVEEAEQWHAKYNKPVLMSEYGADTMDGLHLSPAYVWSEEYQVELMSQHFRAFDELRRQRGDWFVGEFIWNFADFKTAQTYTRVGGNKKGVFTRQREPKMGAHHLRRRYQELAAADNSSPLPADLYSYTSYLTTRTHTEL